MAQYDEDFQFNLLALCQSPLADLRRRILEGIRALEMITLRTSGNPEWENKSGPHHAVPWDPIDGAEKLTEFGLRPEMIPTSRLSEPLKSSVTSALEFPPGAADHPETHNMVDLPPPSAGALAAMAQLWAEVVGDVKEAATQYSVEMGSLAEDEVNVEGRKRDHTPAIHAWVRKLAEKGVLEQLAQ
jgi:ubiquitin carboxyl-terminal hydrolase L5